MSGFSRLLREKILAYYHINVAIRIDQIDRSISRIYRLWNKIAPSKRILFETNGKQILKSLFSGLDFNRINRLYDDQLLPRSDKNLDRAFEAFFSILKRPRVGLHLDYKDTKNKVVGFIYEMGYGIPTDQYLQELVDIFGPRFTACYHVKTFTNWTCIFIDFGATLSAPNFDRRVCKLTGYDQNFYYHYMKKRKIDFR